MYFQIILTQLLYIIGRKADLLPKMSYFFLDQVGVYSPVGLIVTEYTPSYYDQTSSPFRNAFKFLIRYN